MYSLFLIAHQGERLKFIARFGVRLTHIPVVLHTAFVAAYHADAE